MRITFLGTGTSVGVPAIGCDCPVCISTEPRNKRMRASLYVEAGGTHILIDTTPDFRTQALTFRVPRVDAVLLTHGHADHILGFDDIRRFNTIQNCEIPVFGSPDTIADMNRIFDYVHCEHPPGVHRPEADFRAVTGEFSVGPARVLPMEVPHGPKATYGYRIEEGGRSLAYFPDCHRMPVETIRALRGLDIMILDALRHRPHSTHMSLKQSVEALRRIGARVSFVTHLCHDLDHEETQRGLPAGMRVAYDGLTVEEG